MISKVTGIVEIYNQDQIVVVVNGIGYLISCCRRDLNNLVNGQEVTMETYLHVREDALDLYGFTKKIDVQIFKQLISVSGIGPKLAMAILSRYTANDISKAIMEADTGFFTSISGVGKKNAQKIIVELKSKFGSIKDLDLQSEDDIGDTELSEALKSLGYRRDEIELLIKNIPSEITILEEKIRFVLKK